MEFRSSQRKFDFWWTVAAAVVLVLGLVYAWQLQAQTPPTRALPAARGTGQAHARGRHSI